MRAHDGEGMLGDVERPAHVDRQHALERHGLVELVEERRKGNCTERMPAGDGARRT